MAKKKNGKGIPSKGTPKDMRLKDNKGKKKTMNGKKKSLPWDK